jgi:threonylcarbamoyladenosine tRNA methylthiotransferase MtaB
LLKKFCLITLGCKANQWDGAVMAKGLVDLGWVQVPPKTEAALYILNTCTVTHKADREAHQIIRRIGRLTPKPKLWVTGCLAQVEYEALKKFPEVDRVIPQAQKTTVLDLVREPGLKPEPRDPFFGTLGLASCPAGRTRASLKIQDGCDNRCTYCRVPLARGPSISREPAKVIMALETLACLPVREVVLTGIHLGGYGQDLSPPTTLDHLLFGILSRDFPFRVRLSSLEPGEVTGELIHLFQSFPSLCPHLHIPLQSGDDHILASMGRPYRTSEFKELILKLKGALPEICLGADVMAGFPGESDRAFWNTHQFLEGLPLSYLHVFPFSPRPQTSAASLAPRVESKDIKTRAEALKKLGLLKRERFYRGFIGKPLPVLILSKDPATNLWRGLSHNFINLRIPGPARLRNTVVTVLGKEVKNGVLFGEPVG